MNRVAELPEQDLSSTASRSAARALGTGDAGEMGSDAAGQVVSYQLDLLHTLAGRVVDLPILKRLPG